MPGKEVVKQREAAMQAGVLLFNNQPVTVGKNKIGPG